MPKGYGERIKELSQEVDEIYGKNKKARQQHDKYEQERQKVMKEQLDQQNRMLNVEEESERKIEEMRKKGWVK